MKWWPHEKAIRHISKQNTYLSRLAILKLLQYIFISSYIWFLSLWVVTAICKASKGAIFTVPTIVELAGSLGSIGTLGEAKA